MTKEQIVEVLTIEFAYLPNSSAVNTMDMIGFAIPQSAERILAMSAPVWVKVGDSYPKEAETVLVTDGYDINTATYFRFGRYGAHTFLGYGLANLKPTYYQSLPTPPQL